MLLLQNNVLYARCRACFRIFLGVGDGSAESDAHIANWVRILFKFLLTLFRLVNHKYYASLNIDGWPEPLQISQQN